MKIHRNGRFDSSSLPFPPPPSPPLPSPPLSRTLKLTLSINVITRHKLNVLIWRREFNMLELKLRGKCDQYSNLLRCFISIKPLVLLQHYQYHMYIVHRYQVCMGDIDLSQINLVRITEWVIVGVNDLTLHCKLAF